MKILISTLFLTSIFLISCTKEEISDPVNLENKFSINKIYELEKSSLKFTITEISDSRCPSDVECKWEGEARVKIISETPVKDSIVLSTFNNAIDTIANYSFELVDVTPYPISTETIELNDYLVTLKNIHHISNND